MNVIVSYKQKDIIDNANIDAIKDLNGLFNVDDLIAKFKNYFFSKMILDVTSVENFTSREVLQKLVDGIGSDRLIVLLPQTPPPPNEFKKMLIDLRIYNFSNDINDVVRYIDHPNTYETAMKLLDDSFYENTDNANGYIDNSIKGGNDMSNSFNSSASFRDALNSFDIKESNDNMDSEYNVDDNSEDNYSDNSNESFEPITNNEEGKSYEENVEQNNISNDFANNVENNDYYNNDKEIVNSLKEKDNNLSLYNVLHYNDSDKEEKPENSNYFSNVNEFEHEKSNYVFLNIDGLNNIENNEKKVIGFKNVTNHAGSTSLIYMILKSLNDNFKKDSFAVEVNHDDFRLFMNNRMARVSEEEVKEYISSRHEKIILVDLNECNDTSFCDEVIYLIEPSTIMLNKLMVENREIFKYLSHDKVVLNKSLLSMDDVSILSKEAGINFIYNMKPLNDRLNNDEIVNFIEVLGIK